MDVPEAIKICKRRLGFRKDLDLEILDALNECRRDLQRDARLPRPWFLLSEMSSATTMVGESRLPLPTNFLTADEQVGLYYFNSAAENDGDKWVELVKDDWKQLTQLYPTPGPPKAYSTLGLYFHIFPTPDGAYPIKTMFIEEPADYTAGEAARDYLKYEEQLLLTRTLIQLASDLADDARLTKFTTEYLEARKNYIIRHENRFHENRSYTMGGAD